MELVNEGNLEIRGGISSVKHSKDSNSFTAEFMNGSKSIEIKEYDVVINACGTSTDLRKLSPLYQAMSQEGVI